MGLKSDLYGEANKVESKNKELHEIIYTLETMVSKLKSIESALLTAIGTIKSKADSIKE